VECCCLSEAADRRNMEAIRLKTPLSDEDCLRLRAGDRVLLSGRVYTARDEAHRRFYELLREGKELPLDLRGQVIYYAGPTPAPPGRPVGSIGPTTAGRMDRYTPLLLEKGLKGMIGKGRRSPEVREALVKHRAVYFAAVGGVGALLSRRVKRATVILYPELGPEAVHLLEVEDLPLFVVNDCYGNDLYAPGES